jgi:hypothetical protein
MPVAVVVELTVITLWLLVSVVTAVAVMVLRQSVMVQSMVHLALLTGVVVAVVEMLVLRKAKVVEVMAVLALLFLATLRATQLQSVQVLLAQQLLLVKTR